MSNQSLPPQGSGAPNPGSQQNFGSLPGLQNARPAPDEAKISLMKAMGAGFKKLGEELEKGLAMNPTEAARAKAMIAQAQRAAQGAGPQNVAAQRPAPSGGPRPVDRSIDPISGAPIGGQGQGRNTQGF